jgi:UPF0716 protein FxsA
MALILVLLFLVLPIAEIYVIIQVGGAIGVLPTLALLILDGIAGAALARSQGRAAWARFNLALAEGRIPARETFDGAMIVLGGSLLLAPGFITDVVGFLLLIPPTRALMRGGASRLALRRVGLAWTVSGPRADSGSRAAGAGREAPPPDFGRRAERDRPSRTYDYEGTAQEVTDPAAELPPAERDD